MNDIQTQKSISYPRYVRRPDGHMFDPKYIMKSIRFCIKSILIWAAIKDDGSRIFIRCPTLLDSTPYQVVLEGGRQVMYANDSVFIQYGAPWSTMLYLEKKKICILSYWPPQSLNFNVIKNMCSIMKTCLFQFNFTSSDDLWNATLKAWNNIPIKSIYKLYGSTPCPLKVVVKVKGHHSKY